MCNDLAYWLLKKKWKKEKKKQKQQQKLQHIYL